MTELVTFTTFPESGELELIWKLAGRLASTEFVPKDLRGKPEAVLACMLTGRELGIGPMQALRDVFIQNGRPGMMATLMVQRARGAGHRVRTLEQTDQRCTVQVHRKGEQQPEQPITWTIEMARTAGLLGKDNWKKYPGPMLWSRAASAAVRRDCSEVLGGVVYTPEELEEPETEATWGEPLADRETGEVLDDSDRLGGDPKPAQPVGPSVPTQAQIDALDTADAATVLVTQPWISVTYRDAVKAAAVELSKQDWPSFWREAPVEDWRAAFELARKRVLTWHPETSAASSQPPEGAAGPQSPSAQVSKGKAHQAEGDPTTDSGHDG